ncbi:hypothetical protein EYR40_000038 [Pleurotus pulmonarius]|nr:hypothetical protein EYR40_000038 [Pleurotus pulmonarius]
MSTTLLCRYLAALFFMAAFPKYSPLMTPRLTVILEREEPGPGVTPGVHRINRQVFVRKLRSDKRSDVVPSHCADAEPQAINHQEDYNNATNTRSSSPFAFPRRDAVRSDLGRLDPGCAERRSGLRFSSEPPRKIPEEIALAPSASTNNSVLKPLRRPFKDKDSEGCTTWYIGISDLPISQPPSNFGVYGDLYLHSIRGTNGPPLIWLMDDHSAWRRVEEGEPSWVLKASLATMRHRKEKVARS